VTNFQGCKEIQTFTMASTAVPISAPSRDQESLLTTGKAMDLSNDLAKKI
jgi:hypothetical protein